MAPYFRNQIDLKQPFSSINRIRIQQDQRSPKLTLKETTMSKSTKSAYFSSVKIQYSDIQHNQNLELQPYKDILTCPDQSSHDLNWPNLSSPVLARSMPDLTFHNSLPQTVYNKFQTDISFETRDITSFV